MPNILTAQYQAQKPLTRLRRVVVTQKFGNHTLAFLDYRFTDRKQYVLPREGTPFSARWGAAPLNLGTFYGYVNHYESTASDTGQSQTRMVALGTSQRMNSMTPSTWSDITASTIARDMAKRYKMRSVIHNHPWVMDNWTTGPRTDWRALKDLADEIGYLFWVDGPTLYFLDPTKILASASTLSTPRIRNSDILGPVKVLGGTNIPGLQERTERRVIYGLDYTTNELFEANAGDTSLPTSVLPVNVTNFSQAGQVTSAATRREGDYYTVKMTVKGNAGLFPGRLFQVNSGRVNTDQEGLWVVAEAVHTVTSKDFTTELIATRGTESVLVSRVKTTIRGATEQAGAVVRDGKTWEANLQEHVHA